MSVPPGSEKEASKRRPMRFFPDFALRDLFGWTLALGVLAVGWAPFLTLQRLPRYRDIERRVREYEQSLPHYVVQLDRTETTDSLVGGHLKVG